MLRLRREEAPPALLRGLADDTTAVHLRVDHPPGYEGCLELWYVRRWANARTARPDVAALTNDETEARRYSEENGPGEYRLVEESDGTEVAAWTAGLGGDTWDV